MDLAHTCWHVETLPFLRARWFVALAGESPINIIPTATHLPAEFNKTNPTITMEDYDRTRTGLPIFNNGHTIGYSVCANKHGCDLKAKFGTWPKQIRDIEDDNEDEYFLLQMHWHWGSDDTKGSEHLVCSKPRAAELHLVWLNKNNITSDRTQPESGLLLAVTGIMFEGGADQDNPAVASMIDSIHTKAMPPGNGGTGVSINVKDLLPTDWQTKFYTYPGSLTTPPCSQVVSWFVFENFVKMSDAQLAMLRHATMPKVMTDKDEDDDDESGLSGPIIALIAAVGVIAVVGIGMFIFYGSGSAAGASSSAGASGTQVEMRKSPMAVNHPPPMKGGGTAV